MYGIPIDTGAMLVTLLFDFHTAITFSFTISLLTGFWLENAFYPVYAFVGSLTAACGVIRCKKRSALLKAGLSVVLSNVVIVQIVFPIGFTSRHDQGPEPGQVRRDQELVDVPAGSDAR